MDGQRFDQLAKAFANGASRRSLLQGLVGAAVGGAFTQLRTQTARAQCSWSGTFEAPFGGIATVTLNEADGLVTGSYTFPQDNAAREGTISGIVRSEYPGYSVLDGYWREPGEGGRIWFSMPIDSCAQFTGSYTETDASEAWIAGWDGVRTSGGGGEGGGGDVELTIFANRGDTRVAAYTSAGQAVTVFGPKDADGFVEYISQAQIDAPDGDPQKRVFLDFDATGTPTRAALGSGETMAFEAVSDTSIVITYRSADGSQEVQVPFDLDEAAPADTAASSGGASTGHPVAYSGQPALVTTLREHRAGLRVQPPAPPRPLARGTIEVRCGGRGVAINALVSGYFVRPDTPADLVPLSFWPAAGAGPGVYEYTLPLLGPKPPDVQNQETWVTRFQFAIGVICLSNFAIALSPGIGEALCAKLGIATAGTGVPPCAILLASFRIVCATNALGTTPRLVRWVTDSYDQLDVIAVASHPKLDQQEIRFKAYAGYEIPVGVIRLSGRGGDSDCTEAPTTTTTSTTTTTTTTPTPCCPGPVCTCPCGCCGDQGCCDCCFHCINPDGTVKPAPNCCHCCVL